MIIHMTYISRHWLPFMFLSSETLTYVTVYQKSSYNISAENVTSAYIINITDKKLNILLRCQQLYAPLLLSHQCKCQHNKKGK